MPKRCGACPHRRTPDRKTPAPLRAGIGGAGAIRKTDCVTVTVTVASLSPCDAMPLCRSGIQGTRVDAITGLVSNAPIFNHLRPTMRLSRLSSALVASATLGLAASAHAPDGAWQPFVSVSPVYQGNSDVDDCGRFKVDGVTVRCGATTTWGAGNRIGVTLSYDQYDDSFDNVNAFGSQVPWGDVRR